MSQRRKWIMDAWIILFTIAVAWGYLANKHRAHEGHVAKVGICVLVADLENRIKGTEEFLKTHPDGFAGIAKSDLQATARNQQATVNSLTSVIDCSDTSAPSS